ncbi:Trm112 family protein [Aeoliella sp.]|uniref:Trm112 family protein n=1 Tax=Aeoliella sp. TaxID=2795800 RepID=UPI003CCBE013
MTHDLPLPLLRCPVSGGELEWLADDRLARLQQAVEASEVVDRDGDLVTDVPEAALLCETSGLVYPVLGGIPALVPGAAIDVDQFTAPSP